MVEGNLLIKHVVPHAGTWIEIIIRCKKEELDDVVPHAGTWIEMLDLCCLALQNPVVPHAGTWIEIHKTRDRWILLLSFPTRERGLK